MIYEWGVSRRYPIEAQFVGETVARLVQNSGGVCPPGLLVEKARPPRSRLHQLFEWDDDLAADSWRRHQARDIIGSLRIHIEESDSRPPAFVHVRVKNDKNPSKVQEGYAETMKVVEQDDLRDQVLGEALRQLNALRRRFESLGELQPVWAALDDITSAAKP